jgi:hypothetical protein
VNIGRSDIDWKSLSHNEIDRIIAERIEADNKRIEANGGKKSKRAGYILERIAEINNLREADKEAQDGKVRKLTETGLNMMLMFWQNVILINIKTK